MSNYDSDLHRRAVVRLPPDPASASLARRFVMGHLADWRARVPAEETMLLVSEVVTNAVTHVRSSVVVTLTIDGLAVRVEVHDDSPSPPVVAEVEPYADHGRGMFLVDALASRWGVDRDPGRGKTVWFEMLLMRAV